MVKRKSGTGAKCITADALPVRLQISLHNKQEVASKLRAYALRKGATNYVQAIESLINEADYLHFRLQELKRG